MNIQLDYAREQSTDKVYRLTLVDEGLYLMHMSNEGGQPDFNGGTIRRFNQSNESVQDISKTSERGDDPLPNAQMNEGADVAGGADSFFIAFPAIQQAEISRDMLRLKTERGDFDFSLDQSPDKQATAFIDALQAGLEIDREAEGE